MVISRGVDAQPIVSICDFVQLCKVCVYCLYRFQSLQCTLYTCMHHCLSTRTSPAESTIFFAPCHGLNIVLRALFLGLRLSLVAGDAFIL